MLKRQTLTFFYRKTLCFTAAATRARARTALIYYTEAAPSACLRLLTQASALRTIQPTQKPQVNTTKAAATITRVLFIGGKGTKNRRIGKICVAEC